MLSLTGEGGTKEVGAGRGGERRGWPREPIGGGGFESFRRWQPDNDGGDRGRDSGGSRGLGERRRCRRREGGRGRGGDDNSLG